LSACFVGHDIGGALVDILKPFLKIGVDLPHHALGLPQPFDFYSGFSTYVLPWQVSPPVLRL
jgi:hypothetical protein